MFPKDAQIVLIGGKWFQDTRVAQGETLLLTGKGVIYDTIRDVDVIQSEPPLELEWCYDDFDSEPILDLGWAYDIREKKPPILDLGC